MLVVGFDSSTGSLASGLEKVCTLVGACGDEGDIHFVGSSQRVCLAKEGDDGRLAALVGLVAGVLFVLVVVIVIIVVIFALFALP